MSPEYHVAELLKSLGHDLTDEGLRDTPKRYAKFLKEFCTKSPFKFTVFDAKGCNEMIVETEIPFVSLCQHHLLSFRGYACVAYIPNGKIAGASKLPRALDYFASGLQTQEYLTHEVADFLFKKLQPKGVGVALRATHSCMEIRGIKKCGIAMTTTCLLGAFKTDVATRAEFMAHVATSLKA